MRCSATSNFVVTIIASSRRRGSGASEYLTDVIDLLALVRQERERIKYRQLYSEELRSGREVPAGYNTDSNLSRRYVADVLRETDSTKADMHQRRPFDLDKHRPRPHGRPATFPVYLSGRTFEPPRNGGWKTNRTRHGPSDRASRDRMHWSERLGYVRFIDDFPVFDVEQHVGLTLSARIQSDPKLYVVQTLRQSRPALHPDDHRPWRPRARPDLRLRHDRLRRRAMGPPLDHHRHLPRRARARSRAHHGRALSLLPPRRQPRGQRKEAEVTRTVRPSTTPTHGDIRHGFVYERVPHITLKSIANNAEIDVIWEKCQANARTAARSPQRSARSRPGKNGRSRARPTTSGRRAAKSCTPNGGSSASPARRRSTPPSPPRPIRVPLRQAVRGQNEGPRRRPVHRRKPLARTACSASTRTTN